MTVAGAGVDDRPKESVGVVTATLQHHVHCLDGGRLTDATIRSGGRESVGQFQVEKRHRIAGGVEIELRVRPDI